MNAPDPAGRKSDEPEAAGVAGVASALPTHAEALAVIHGLSFSAADAWSANVIGLQLGLPNVFGLYDPRGAMVLVRVVADESEILTIAVIPALRRQGIARTLLDLAMDRARAMGARMMFLEVAVSNRAAQALYDRAGFRRVGRRARYYPGGADALVLRADLTGLEEPC